MRITHLKTEDPNSYIATVILFSIIIFFLGMVWLSLEDQAYRNSVEKICAEHNGTLYMQDTNIIQCIVISNKTVKLVSVIIIR